MAKPSTHKVYSTKQIAKMTVIFQNRNVQMSILKITGESIVTLLNKLPYLLNSGHHKSQYRHIVIKLLKIENRS